MAGSVVDARGGEALSKVDVQLAGTPYPSRSDVLSLIPGEGLIQHGWRDHGTCSGLSSAAYFDTVRGAYESVTIPPDLRQLGHRVELSPREIEAKFIAANPRLKDSIRVHAREGSCRRYAPAWRTSKRRRAKLGSTVGYSG